MRRMFDFSISTPAKGSSFFFAALPARAACAASRRR